MGANRPGGADDPPGISAAPDGWLAIGDAIDLLHRAGGRVFWAHPLVYESDPARLDAYVAELKALGLDGLEAIYAPFSESQRAELCQLAQKHGLLVSAGTDIHADGNGAGQLSLQHRDAPRRLDRVSGSGLRRPNLCRGPRGWTSGTTSCPTGYRPRTSPAVASP